MTFGRYLAIIFLFLYLSQDIALAQEDRTNLELIEIIKNIPLSPDIYSETANIRSVAVLFFSYEPGNTRNPDNNRFADSTKKFLEEFNDIFQKSRNTQPAYHKEGVDRAFELRNEVIYLESLYKSSEKLRKSEVVGIVNSENTSLNRFLDEQGDYFEDTAEKEIAMPLRIEYLEYAAAAYRGSGNAKYESVNRVLAEMKSNFDRDMGQASNSYKKADEIMMDMERDEKGLFGLLSGYVKSRDAIRNYLDTLEIYKNNGISDRTLPRLPEKYAKNYNELVTKNNDAEEMSSSIFRNLITSLLKILTPMLLILIIFMMGFREWRRDFTDMKLNTVVKRD